MKKTSLIYCRGFPDDTYIHNKITKDDFISYYPRFLEILNFDKILYPFRLFLEKISSLKIRLKKKNE